MPVSRHSCEDPLKYERGNWFIDDLGGEKEGIRDYLITNGY